jgi:hypothetical protein
MIAEDLKAMARKVAELRGDCEGQGKVIGGLKDELVKTPEFMALGLAQGVHSGLYELLSKAEAELKVAALEVYRETGEKNPIDKVQVKMFKEIDYNLLEAETWCRTFAPAMLTLNKKAFDKTAENFPDAPVKINEVPKATIGTDLSMYLSEEKRDE